MTRAGSTPTPDRVPHTVHAATAAAIGAASALIALVPWLLTGARLPLQNLWATEVRPQDMPLALLPLSNYSAVETSAMLVIGAAIAGAVAAICNARGRIVSARMVLVGVLVVQLGALAHAAIALRGGLGDGSRAELYLWTLVGAAALSIALGALVLLGIASRRPAPFTLSVSAAAVALGQWLIMLVAAAFPTTTTLPAMVWNLTAWLPPVVVGVAVGWCGVRSVGRAAASVASVVIIWAGPAFLTALFYGLGSRIYLQYPAELVPAMRQVFGLALGNQGQGPQRVIITVALAVLTAAVLYGLRRSDRASVDAPPSPPDAASELADVR